MRYRIGTSVRGALRSLIGESALGMADYYRFPERRRAWGGPFNGQRHRGELFAALVEELKPVAIVETGTYLGTTTEFIAGMGVPVYSVEANPRFYGFARARLWRQSQVKLQCGNSRTALASWFKGPLRVGNATVLVYLDAHWGDELPLAEELGVIFRNCPAAVVMVDDFQVVDDPAYGYDEYGPGKSLTAEYIWPIVTARSLAVLYPAAPAATEGGARRGCVVLARSDVHGDRLKLCRLLRPAPLWVAASRTD